MPRVFLVNPAVSTFGYGLITPRWLFVIAQATPMDLVDDLILIDESIERFDPNLVEPNDIVGIGITTGNCAAGYKIIKESKKRGAKVIAGGVHPTIFPDEPIEFGADAVVTGNGDQIWQQVVRDALNSNLQRKYVGGKLPGDQLLSGRWDLVDPSKYIAASVQTIAGCPENCSFCSVWVTEGRKPRQRMTDKVIAEVNHLYSLGFRHIFFADDNFNPSTLGRIKREEGKHKRTELEKIRSERLAFFDEYSKATPHNIYGFTQITSEITSDPEYLKAMHDKMRIRGALVGVESFTEEGLKSANKKWNPIGQKMVETIQSIEESGIMVLSSVICGLESDTELTLRETQKFLLSSETTLAQFVIYSPYPGTVDFYKMAAGNSPTSLLYDKFWLDPRKPPVLIKHPSLDSQILIKEVRKSWRKFYSIRQVLKRVWIKNWNLKDKAWYFLISMAFHYIYAKDGISADYVRERRKTQIPAHLMKLGVSLLRRSF